MASFLFTATEAASSFIIRDNDQRENSNGNHLEWNCRGTSNRATVLYSKFRCSSSRNMDENDNAYCVLLLSI